MRNQLRTYKDKPAHLDPRATDFFNMRITPPLKELIKDAAIRDGVSMTVIGLRALKAWFKPVQGAQDLKWQ